METEDKLVGIALEFQRRCVTNFQLAEVGNLSAVVEAVGRFCIANNLTWGLYFHGDRFESCVANKKDYFASVYSTNPGQALMMACIEAAKVLETK